MKNFNDIYAEVLQSSKTELEQLRKSVLYRVVGCIAVAIILVIVGFALDSGLMIFGIFACIIVAFILLLGPATKYSVTYKEQVVKKFIKAYDENLEFLYQKGIPKETYTESAFENFDRYHSEDLIMGNIDGHNMMIAEVHTEREYETTDDDGHTETRYETVFHGLFGVSELDKAYNGMVKIHADKGLFSKVHDNRNRIEMDSSEFEKHFDVMADDKIQAMQILTSDIMDLMLNFLKDSKIKFELTIRNNKLYIRFKTGGMFEGNIIKSSVDFDSLKKVYDVINFTFDITRAFAKVIDETEI